MPSPTAQRITILGGGPAGYEAALVAAELGADVSVVSDEGLGGNCVLWDCVPSKSLIVSAEAMGWMHQADELGVRVPEVDELDRTYVDYRRVADRVMSLGREQSKDIESKVVGAGARIVRGRGRISGRNRVTVDLQDGGEETLEPHVLLVATGSSPRVLPFFEPDGERVLTAKHVYDLPEVPERLIVVGSGATGAEFAHAFTRFGSEVVLVSSRELILPTEDADAAALLEEVFERRGMTILREVRAQSCRRTDDGVVVGLNDGSELEGTHVLFTVGQVPASDGIGLDVEDVHVEEWGGIPVDGVSRTNAPWIYAAGDVVGRMMLANVAAMQGRTAMWHVLGQAVSPIRWDAVTSTIFTDPEVATTGLTGKDCEEQDIPYRTSRLDFSGNPRAKMSKRQDGFVKVFAMPGSGTVLGGVVVSADASDLIQPLAVAVHNRLTVSQLATTSTVYPSMAGSISEAARLLMPE